MVVILDLHAVVRVDAAAIGYVQVVMTETVVIGDDVYPRFGSPLELSAQALACVCRRVGLPSVDDPRLNFQVWIGKDLDSHAGEEPWCIGRNVRRLVGPVVIVVKKPMYDMKIPASRLMPSQTLM